MALPAVLRFERWPDPSAEANGHAVTSPYVETFWLPIIGPSSLLLARRLARMVDPRVPHTVRGNGWKAGPIGAAVEVDTARLACSLGLKVGTLAKTLHRLAGFGFIRTEVDNSGWLVHTHVSSLGPKRVAGLPEHLALLHEQRREVNA